MSRKPSSILTRWAAKLEVPSGSLAGNPLRLFPWQRTVLRELDDPRLELAISMARGGGKTTFLAFILAGFMHPDFDLMPRGGEAIIAASSMAQGRLAFGDGLDFLRQCPELDIDDKSKWRLNDSANRAELRYLPLNTRLMALGNDPKKMHGRRPVIQLGDEVAQWDSGKVAAMMAAMKTAGGKSDCRTLWIGTAPLPGTGHPFETELAKPNALIWRADPEDDIYKPSTWHRANPSLKFLPSLRAAYEDEAETAKTDEAAEIHFRALRLNGGGAGVSDDVLIHAATWLKCEARTAERTGAPVVAVDLASSGMAGAAACWPTGAVDAFAAFPLGNGLADRGRKDGCGDLYERMEARGELILSAEHHIKIADVLDEIVGRWGIPSELVADRWRESELRQALEDTGFPRVPLTLRGMGERDGGADVREFRRATADWVSADESLLLRHSISVARVTTTPSGNQKFKRHGTARDDAAVALTLAVAAARRRRSVPTTGRRFAVV